MNPNRDTESAQIRKLQNRYNVLPNVIWSVLGFLPVSIFCYHFVELKYIYIFSALSVFSFFLPNAFFDRIQLSKAALIYEKLGVHRIKGVAQNGAFINRLIRKKYPDFKVVSFNSTSAKRLLQQTYIYEKFHFALFLLFCLITVYSLGRKCFTWAFVITLTNLIYNIYPNLLQQYIRIKLGVYNRRLKPN